MRGFIFLLLLVLIPAGGYYAYTHYYKPMPIAGDLQGGAPPEAMAMMMVPQVDVAEVLQKEIALWKEFSGRLVAVEYAEVRPRVAGEIETVDFKDGALVKKGDVLFTIDPRPYKAEFDRASAQLTLAKNDFVRAEKLFKEKAISKGDFDQRQSALKVAEAAEALARLNLGYTQVLAPIDGRVGRVEITAGNLVPTGEVVLTTIASVSPIYADFEMDEKTFLTFVQAEAGKAGGAGALPVELGLSTEEGTPHKGYIDSFDNRLNPASGTIRVRAVFDNPEGALVPGLFARVRLAGAAPESVSLVTDRAIGTDQNKKFLLVLGAGDTVEYREVTLGGMVEGFSIITSGLNAGDRVIVNGLQKARPGAPVKPNIISMQEADTPPSPPSGAPH